MKIFKKSLSVFLALVMALSFAGILAFADDEQSGTITADGTAVSGSIASADEADTYTFTAEKGFVTVTFASQSYSSLSVAITDAATGAAAESFTEACPCDSLTSPKIGLEGGTYILTVSASVFDETSGNEYTVSVKNEKNAAYESEQNGESGKADAIDTSAGISGSLFTKDDEDWFTFTITDRSNITFAFTADSSDKTGKWNAVIYDSDMKAVDDSCSFSFSGGFEKQYSKQAAGTYYIKVTAGTYSSADYNISVKPVSYTYSDQLKEILSGFGSAAGKIDWSTFLKNFEFLKSINWLQAAVSTFGAIVSVVKFLKNVFGN